VTRGTDLTQQLLTFAGRQAIHPEPIDLAAHLSAMRDMLERTLRGDIRVGMNFGADLWSVEIDGSEFELAMLNLFANARDAMAGGGTITIDARNLKAAADDGSLVDLVQLSIADTGSGIPPEVLDRAFEPFFTTKEIGKGSGLGLPQVHGFAQQSGGRLRIDSRVGAGTTVTLLLPRSLRKPAAPLDTSRNLLVRGDSAHGRHVLLVEDDAEVAALTSEMLSQLGFHVIHAASATAALGALANERRIDLVFSDIMMAGDMDGISRSPARSGAGSQACRLS
jgi:CheY-like chemotaxis protein